MQGLLIEVCFAVSGYVVCTLMKSTNRSTLEMIISKHCLEKESEAENSSFSVHLYFLLNSGPYKIILSDFFPLIFLYLDFKISF